MYETTKPKLSIEDQISHLSYKGVKFNISSIKDATIYLNQNNNYFKLTAYRKSFIKHPDGPRKGQYIDLDFEYLKDLAIIDMRLRYILIRMALDIEHFSKVHLLKIIEGSDENGYDIVKRYMDNLDELQQGILQSEMRKVKGNPYCGNILAKYENDFPVWAFIEIITFGRFISFYKFFADEIKCQNLTNDYYLLLAIKELRNAVAHNNCLINDLAPNTAKHGTNYGVNRALSNIGVSKDIRDRKMSNVRVQQIVTLFYIHKEKVESRGIYEHQCKELNDFIKRMYHHINYYSKNETVITTFDFFKQVIDRWFPCEYN